MHSISRRLFTLCLWCNACPSLAEALIPTALQAPADQWARRLAKGHLQEKSRHCFYWSRLGLAAVLYHFEDGQNAEDWQQWLAVFNAEAPELESQGCFQLLDATTVGAASGRRIDPRRISLVARTEKRVLELTLFTEAASASAFQDELPYRLERRPGAQLQPQI